MLLASLTFPRLKNVDEGNAESVVSQVSDMVSRPYLDTLISDMFTSTHQPNPATDHPGLG